MKKKALLLFMMTMVMLSGAKADGDYFDANGGYFGPTTPATEEKDFTGAYYTGNYVSPFKAYLGKTDEDIQTKLDQLWNHYFKGGDGKQIYYENSTGTEAYIKDIYNSDIRSEGMSYGMMICVQTNHKAEFDKLWKFAKSHMWHNPSYSGDGYFSWHCETNGETKEQGCCPDAEMYFMMSLLFAANRWGDASYMEDAQAILQRCWKGNEGSLFNEQVYIITFQPYNCHDFSDPSYDLPAFVDLFARWSTTNNYKWSQAVSATRNHLYKSSHPLSGLFSDYNNFDGTPHYAFSSNSQRYSYDAMRCAMNFGMDYYLFGADAARQTTMAKRIIDFFESDNYTHARFNWDGTDASESYTLGETGCNAVACYALMGEEGYHDIIAENLKKAWDASLMTGSYRYYDGIVHYLAMLHLCGAFKIWKPRLVLNETDGVTPLTKAPWQSAAEIPSSFTRTFTAGVPSTVCLPFPVDASQAAAAGKFYTFAGVNKTSDNWEVVMQESAPSNLVSGALAANTPYLFIPAATGEVTFFGMIPNTVGAETSSAINGWTFIGTYDKRQWDDSNHTAEIGSVYGFAAQAGTSTGGQTVEAGQFFRVAGGENSYVAPFRAYLKYTGGGSARMRAAADNLPQSMTVRLINADGTETGISDALRQENQMNNNVWYSVNGVQFNQQPTAKGVYLHNGKKVVIK